MRSLLLLSLLASTVAVGCSGGPFEDEASTEDDLTSVTARARKLTFTGYVYEEPGASEASILRDVRAQTQTAFGALRSSEIAVASRELKGVDPSTFKKEKVVVADPNKPGDPGREMLKVTYRYSDDAIVPVAMARRTTLSSAVMSPDYSSQSQRILRECTANDSHAREFASSIWYVFEPSRSSCKTAMSGEQKQIDADKAKVGTGKIPTSEVARLYIPLVMRFSAAKTERGNTYPEYDRLYTGGVKPNRLVISMVNGLIDHESHASPNQDSAWGEWMDQLHESMAGRSFKFSGVDGGEDLTSYSVNGKTVRVPGGFMDAITMQTEGTGYPAGLSWSDRSALMAAISKKVTNRWLRFEAPVKVKIGAAPEKDVIIEIMTYFGAGSSAAPHKFAIKNSDVFLYNGHSYVGYGPLDPSNFTRGDFPSSYQILFVDGCVSYNYYNADYFPLKGGTQNLDMIINGLEAPSWRSGYALGRFTHRLIDGSQASYATLLREASDTDSLRAVDGEVDNAYSPRQKPITVR